MSQCPSFLQISLTFISMATVPENSHFLTVLSVPLFIPSQYSSAHRGHCSQFAGFLVAKLLTAFFFAWKSRPRAKAMTSLFYSDYFFIFSPCTAAAYSHRKERRKDSGRKQNCLFFLNCSCFSSFVLTFSFNSFSPVFASPPANLEASILLSSQPIEIDGELKANGHAHQPRPLGALTVSSFSRTSRTNPCLCSHQNRA